MIGKLVEAEAAAISDLDRASKRFRIAAEQPVHLVRRLDVAVGVTFASIAEGVDRDVVADAGHDVLQNAATRLVKEDVVRHHRGHAHLRGEVRHLVKAKLVIGATV